MIVSEAEAMDRALALARRGWGRVAPNPLVGAVLLRGGDVLAEGWHAEFGGPHAEAAALAAHPEARGATCVVNLEPCAHHGKTPPCADALVAAGVRRVVVAVRDPHPAAAGGIARLQAAGVQVDVGLRAADAAALNAPFLWNATRPDRPFVAVKVATSLDGFVADAEGRSRWLSGSAAREWVHWLRAGFGAIAVGRRTAEADDPALTVRGPVTPRTPPVRLVVSGAGTLRSDLALVRSAGEVPTWLAVVGGASAPAELAASGVTLLQAASLEALLGTLRREGIDSVLVEGGGALVGSLLGRDLVDRVYWIQTPRWLGRGVPAFGDRPATGLDAAPGWAVVERRALGPDTLLVVDRSLCLPAS